MAKIALFGGAFDPIHCGHLAVAKHALMALELDEVRFIPCADPVHKPACQASPWQRAAMIALAINGHARLILDTRELERPSPSYAIDTIEQFIHAQGSTHHLYWLLGADALMGFEAWHRWQHIMALVDLVVVNRPSQTEVLVKAQAALLQRRLQEKGHALHRLAMEPHFQASSQIRKHLSDDMALPALVKPYIEAEGLYR